MKDGFLGRLAAAVALALVAVPAHAQQFSDTYKFLKAVKDRDGTVATDMLAQPGSIVINAKDSSGDAALHILTRQRDMLWVGFLLGKGAKPDIQDRDGDTPLALAAQIGWVEGAERLLSSGAKVDLANSRGETPLILAVHSHDVSMVRLLLSRGANPSRTDSVAGYSALDYAKQDNRSAAIAKMLEDKVSSAKSTVGPSPH